MNKLESGRTLADYQGLLRRRRHYLLTIIPATLLLAIFIAYILPPKYRASGTIMLEDSSLPQNVVTTVVTQYDESPERAAQALELLRRKVMKKDSLIEVVKEIDPYPLLKTKTPSEKAEMLLDDSSVERVDPITFQPLEQSRAFSIHYLNRDPDLAAAVDQKLVELFVTYNQRSRAEESREAYRFLQAQAKQLEQEMDGQEKQLAQFKAKYGDALPEMEARNLAGVDRTQRDLDTVQHDIITAEQQEAQFQLQLSSISPSLVAAVSDWRTELAKTRGDLAEAEQKYTPEHPDVKRLRRAVADLLAKGAGGSVTGEAPDNPDYLTVQSQLTGARRLLTELRGQEAKARADLALFEKNLTGAPNVEREYVQLAREHDNSHNSYIDLQNKMKNAALAQTLETEARGERFTLLRAAVPPNKAYFPNRLGIILLGLVLGCGIAFGIAAAVDASDPTLRGNSDLQMIMQTSALGSVPYLMNPKDMRRQKLVWGSALAGFTVAAVLVAATVLTAH
jgi:polysaccharide chain length determinant protein (PEP-CTERM system associated)